MATNVDQIVRECRTKMDKSVEHYEKELRGLRTGRATTALLDYLKVDYYGNATELKSLAAISVAEATQLMVKPFDPSVKGDIIKAIEKADLGLNPQSEGGAIRINVPAPSRERRLQLVGQVKKMAEDSKISIRNERRDALKHIDTLVKDKSQALSEDDAKRRKDEIESMTKKHVETIDQMCAKKSEEIQEV